ncbi:MAG TPA: MATE family efflux transporter [Steroidobacteraceae bacterium]|jgi:putative MATE family efflux protein|nr:MATE family efflux transporter [Steroidobacteraceae bacterium]
MSSVESTAATPVPQRPHILQLALPSIAANLMFSMVALVQTKFVGGLGASAVAAVGAGQRVFFALQAVFTAIGVGTTALVSRSWGAGQREEAGRITITSLVVGAAAGAIITLTGMLFSRNIADLFGLDEYTANLASRNIFWLSAFICGFAIDIIFSGALRAAGNVWTPLVFGLAVNLVNLPLLYAFIFGKLGAPRMGPAGAAFASGLSLTLCGSVLLLLWSRQRLTIKFLSSDLWRLDRYRHLFHIAYPVAIEQLVLQAGFFLFLSLIGRFYGTEAFAAYNVGVNMLNAAMVIGTGFSIAGSTLVGQNLGAGDLEAAARSGWRACALAVSAMAMVGLIVVLNAPGLAHFFLGTDQVGVQRATEFTYILAAMMPLLGVDMAIGGSLRGAGDTRFPLMSTFLGLIGMRCGLAALFTAMHLPVVWVYSSIIGDYVLKGSLLIWRFKSGRWKHAIHARLAAPL